MSVQRVRTGILEELDHVREMSPTSVDEKIDSGMAAGLKRALLCHRDVRSQFTKIMGDS